MPTEKYELPLYRKSLSEAYQDGDSELWLISHRLNVECRDYIDQLVREHFSGNYLDGEISVRAIEKYGIERVGWVLANTVQQHSWDGRFRPHNHEWAKAFPIPEGRNYEFVTHTHSEIVNGLVDQYRDYVSRMEAMDENDLPPWAKGINDIHYEIGYVGPTM